MKTDKQYNAEKMVVVLDFLIAADKILKEYDFEYRDALLYQITSNYYGLKKFPEEPYTNKLPMRLLKTLIDLRANIIPGKSSK